MRGHTALHLGKLDDVRVSVADHQGATVLSLVADVFGGRGHGVPVQWRQLVLDAVPAAAGRVLRPLFDPGYSVIPDCVTPTASMPRGDVLTQCEQLRDLSADVLLAELETEFGGAVPAQWRPVVDRPAQWIRAYAQVVQAVWRAFVPVWERARPLLERETERVGSAVVRGCADTVLSGLSSRSRLTDDLLLLPDPQSDTYTLDGRRVVLVPVVSGPGTCMFALDRTDLVWIGYPLPGLGRLWDADAGPRPDPDGDTLALVVGDVRARVLRAVAAPATMGDVAVRVGCSPANLTHHCARLEQSGLIVRRREGQYVRLGRTPRGDALVDLLA
ncbi:ArsR/SmtB family transcription factor [Streptomyces hyderabadensis]|uniref:Transcriptional regulator n=1 Tax=Streptomyces hyderabadensis TaxID=598549 RepID=A0ABP9HPP2_9ACTN|nr:winged helix-turn-helix domain-containing protein [Streptomyces hyderabadensis]